jgi:hypothetical protein
MKPSSMIRSAGAAGAAGLVATVMGLSAAPAFGAAQTGSAAGFPFDLGPSPVGLPANCPFANGDANFVFLSGSFVQHDTTKPTGDWGGATAQGTAQFYEDSTPLYQGHLTLWEGGGNNAQSQTENGFTLDFNGSGAAGTLHIHIDAHGTTNNAGVQTANHQNVTISCG